MNSLCFCISTSCKALNTCALGCKQLYKHTPAKSIFICCPPAFTHHPHHHQHIRSSPPAPQILSMWVFISLPFATPHRVPVHACACYIDVLYTILWLPGGFDMHFGWCWWRWRLLCKIEAALRQRCGGEGSPIYIDQPSHRKSIQRIVCVRMHCVD